MTDRLEKFHTFQGVKQDSTSRGLLSRLQMANSNQSAGFQAPEYLRQLQHQDEYNIVRESDLLAGYDVERCIVYGMIGRNFNYKESFLATKELYYKRMARQIEDNLFFSKYGLMEAEKLDKENRIRLIEIQELLN